MVIASRGSTIISQFSTCQKLIWVEKFSLPNLQLTPHSICKRLKRLNFNCQWLLGLPSERDTEQVLCIIMHLNWLGVLHIEPNKKTSTRRSSRNDAVSDFVANVSAVIFMNIHFVIEGWCRNTDTFDFVLYNNLCDCQPYNFINHDKNSGHVYKYQANFNSKLQLTLEYF